MLTGLFDPLHVIILLVVTLLIFGPRRLPELGSSIGKTLKMFKEAQKGWGSTEVEDASARRSKE
ncbi:MAG: twin-arginine translocase TatA/TatE family subunit [Sulfobacillus thermotolerans]|uniref:Sec-independent protein translocase TatA n=1 Tax=Sulfobacillus thermotolerans TaxID=338644 RepID=A0ABM6RTW4_9FIRM|nr:Sec-independent protein translocase TatA [Sulfobacillus thermotolerans]MCY0909036.1 twin-arginine translocase TatA/TatE family subunit [Sulfobacillus thermotolerans]